MVCKPLIRVRSNSARWPRPLCLVSVVVTLFTCIDGKFLRARKEQPGVEPWTPPPEYFAGTYGHKYMYLANIAIGSDRKTFRVLVDTGSSQLVLPSEFCDTEACRKHPRFSAAQSRSAKNTSQTLMIGYGSGPVSGHIFEDRVCLPTREDHSAVLGEVLLQTPPRELCARMQFLAADVENDEIANSPFDGILGLGAASDDPAVGGPQFSFLKQLVAANMINNTAFALHLTNNGDSELNLEGASEQELAGGQISWWNMSPLANGYWQFSVCDLTMDGVPQHFGKLEVGIDSGTSLLAADSDLKNWMEQKLQGGSDCSNVNGMPKIGLKRHDGSTLMLLPSDYIDEREGKCSLALMPSFNRDNGQRLRLGASFLRRYVTVFDRDNARIGFGVAADDMQAPQLVQSLFPSESSTSSECEDHEMNNALEALGSFDTDFDRVRDSDLKEQQRRANPAE